MLTHCCTQAREPVISNNPDFVSLLTAPNGDIMSFVHFESPNPSQVYALGLEQDPSNGKLSVKSTAPVNMSEYGGLWIMCAGSVTPWGVHIGGEEYEPNAAAWEKATGLWETQDGETSYQALDPDSFQSVIQMLRYFGIYAIENETTLEEAKEVFNPYLYGYGVTFEPNDDGTGTGQKWYTTGRLSQELVYVMPNGKTAYITDDGTNVGFFRLELDNENDLSSGTLYAAKLTQTSAEGGGAFDIEWVELGQGNQDDLKEKVKSIQFSDMFDSADPAEDDTCPDGFISINAGGRGQECLKVVDGAEDDAAFFETRRYAAYLGATTEASKWEGFAFDPETSTAYTSISDVRYGMEDFKKKGENETKYDQGGPNHIALEYNPCGCVYALPMDSDYVATGMTAALCGKPKEVDANNTCGLGKIANPDNVAYFGGKILIGEDTSAHQNDAVWSWNPKTGELTRIMTTPFGAESTGIYFTPDINGFSYLSAVVQHPYGETDTELVDKKVNEFSEGPGGYVGFWTFPSSIDPSTISFERVEVPKTADDKSKVLASNLIA